MATKVKRRMTETEATSFGKVSATSINTILANRHCNCDPYNDWFTFKRWIAQGQCVNKGAHGIKLICYAPGELKVDEDTRETVEIGKKWYTAYVFCRCQVHLLNNDRPHNQDQPIKPETITQPVNDDITIKLTSPLTGNDDITDIVDGFLATLAAANVSSMRGN